LEVGQQVFGVESGGGVVACGGAHQPALGRQGVDDVLLEGEFFTVGQGGLRGRGGTQVKLSAYRSHALRGNVSVALSA
jgi:hypothetical protein